MDGAVRVTLPAVLAPPEDAGAPVDGWTITVCDGDALALERPPAARADAPAFEVECALEDADAFGLAEARADGAGAGVGAGGVSQA